MKTTRYEPAGPPGLATLCHTAPDADGACLAPPIFAVVVQQQSWVECGPRGPDQQTLTAAPDDTNGPELSLLSSLVWRRKA